MLLGWQNTGCGVLLLEVELQWSHTVMRPLPIAALPAVARGYKERLSLNFERQRTWTPNKMT